MTDRELMQQALDALITAELDGNCEYGATEALRARLAQPEQPQIVWIDNKQTGNFLNMAPPQREWQGLTDEELRSLWDDHVVPMFGRKHMNPIVYGRALEVKLKDRNHG